MISLKVKTRSGMIQTLQVEQLIEIDGERYLGGGNTRLEEIERRLEFLEGLVVPVTVEQTEEMSVAQ